MRWLPLALLLGFAQPAQAQYIGMYDGHLGAGGSLTKLGENDYRFDYFAGWGDYWFPTSGIDPTTGYPVGYSLYGNVFSRLAGDFPGTYEYSDPYGVGFEGWLKCTAPPIGSVGVEAFQSIEGQIRYPGNIYGRIIAGELQGRATLIGDIPTEIGQSTGWAQTPEPSTLCLLGLGLLALTVGRKISWAA